MLHRRMKFLGLSRISGGWRGGGGLFLVLVWFSFSSLPISCFITLSLSVPPDFFCLCPSPHPNLLLPLPYYNPPNPLLPPPPPTASMLPALCLPLWSLLSINPQRSVCLLQIRHNASDRQCNASSAAAATTKTAAGGVGGKTGFKKY